MIVLEISNQTVKERVLEFYKKLNLTNAFDFIEKTDLSPESNAFLNILTAIFLHYSRSAAIDVGQQELLKIARESYEMLAMNFGGCIPKIVQSDFTISGDGDIKVRIYKKEDTPAKTLILYAHGGGWSRGNLETHNTLCARLCYQTGWDVLAVDYRLAPEHPYPAALNDMEGAYNWAQQQYQTIAFSGDSAGGNLVTALTLKLRHNKVQQPKALLLFYPSFDLRILTDDPSPYAKDYFLSRDRINQLIMDYLQHNLENAVTNSLISPTLEKDLNHFPYTVVISAECDPLCQEAYQFVNKLKVAGNQVDHLVVPRVLHAFAQFFGLYPEAEEALEYMSEKLRRVKI